MTFAIYTLGCRVNQYESRVISENLTALGYAECDFSKKCDIYIINTCAVTAESVRKSKQIIRRAKKLNPHGKVIVTGCFAQMSRESEESLNEIDFVVGNGKKIGDVLKAVTENSVEDSDFDIINSTYENYSLNTPTRAREYIKIQDGCNGKCTYCIIPKLRGTVRSKPLSDVLNEVETFAQKGVKEIILTGIEIASYQYGLTELINEIEKIDGIERISLGSLEPTLITEEFLNSLSTAKKLTPHVHLSVQSGSTTVLNRMKRKYNSRRLEKSVSLLKMKIPNIMLTCDIIVGFPGETEEEFEETRQFLERSKFVHAHIFTYSKRPDTPAAAMPGQIPQEIKNRRSALLSDLQKEIRRRILADEINSRNNVPVLFETKKGNTYIGHSDNYIEYHCESNENIIGNIVDVTPISSDEDFIIGKI